MFCAGERFTLLTAHCSRPAYVRIVCARSLIRGSVRGRKPDRGERRRYDRGVRLRVMPIDSDAGFSAVFFDTA